jgi:hypothetical protein
MFLAATTVTLLFACGPQAEDEEPAIDDEVATSESELATLSPGNRIIVWQQNIEAMKAGKQPAKLLTNAMLGWTYKPDIVMLQEAWQRVLCDDYLGEATDPSLENWKHSLTDGNGASRTCGDGRPPAVGSVLHQLGTALWGGVGNVGHRRPNNDILGAHSRTGVTVIWDKRRFTFEDSFVYSDADVPGCSDVLESYKRIAVLLRDTRRTADPSDDRLVAVASVHYASSCLSDSNRWVAEQMVTRWHDRDGLALSLRFIGGDFNARADESSATYVERRREETPVGWYRAITQNTKWKGGTFLDPVKTRHPDTGGDSSALCSAWTYPAVSSCAAKTACSATCPGFGISGKLDRLDYLFTSDGDGALPGSRILSAETDDTGAAYADHKATRVSVAQK